MKTLLYLELSYKIIGSLFEVYNQLRYGHKEKIYQKDINQLLSYLKYKNYKLGILAIFARDGLKYKRLANTR